LLVLIAIITGCVRDHCKDICGPDFAVSAYQPERKIVRLVERVSIIDTSPEEHHFLTISNCVPIGFRDWPSDIYLEADIPKGDGRRTRSSPGKSSYGTFSNASILTFDFTVMSLAGVCP
jgi:hypothetical protein